MSVSGQAYVFLYSVIGGMLIAFIYDLFRIKRKTFKTRKIATFFDDLIFWIMVALVMFAVVYYSNEGEIRGYILIGTVIGVILYVLLLSRFVMMLFLTIINFIGKVLKAIWSIISYPFIILLKLLRRPCGYALKTSRKALRKAKNIGRNRLVKISMWRRMLKNIIKKI